MKRTLFLFLIVSFGFSSVYMVSKEIYKSTCKNIPNRQYVLAQNVKNFVHQNIKYCRGRGDIGPTSQIRIRGFDQARLVSLEEHILESLQPDVILARGWGNCNDFAVLTSTILEDVRINNFLIVGINFFRDTAHVWNEIVLDCGKVYWIDSAAGWIGCPDEYMKATQDRGFIPTFRVLLIEFLF